MAIDPAIEQSQLTERKPYYRIRGKSVTEDQAIEIIRRTDWVIDHSEAAGPDYVFTCGFDNSWLCSKQCETSGFGWAHPDGTIGTNWVITYKYPSIEDVFIDGLSIALAFPFVNMIIAITDWNEQPPYAWEDETDKYEDEKDDNTYPDFAENIEVGIWIHDNEIELLASVRARAKYE